MAIHAVNNFKSILAPDVLPFCLVSVSWFQSLIPYRCSPEACLSLSSIPDAPTITKTILKLNPNKSSGPDGLTSGFFKGAWSILGEEVVCSIQRLFLTDYLINLRLSKPHKKLLLIAWQCVIYLLWTERNSRLHRRSFRSPQSLLTTLDLTVRNRCSSLQSQNPATSSSMIQLWF
ncbi:hypothetical protein HID58_040797 [Brassica napus]|uniref:Reverse transcriptase n=1 Tax=Brassica napus TaxID=3708 RepID=A0ABQ8B924_BRANA|nr:hypothetical protein HID58_040797 [Brassica napus]